MYWIFAVPIAVTPGHWNKFNHWHTATVWNAPLPYINLKTGWNCTLELLDRLYWLGEFTSEWLKKSQFSSRWPLCRIQYEWAIVKHVMEGLRLFQHWTMWMSNRHAITLHHIITFLNDMFDRMDVIMQALAKRTTQWKEDCHFMMKCAQQTLSKWYMEVTPMTCMTLIPVHILDLFQRLQLFHKWNKQLYIPSEDGTSCTTAYNAVLLKYVDNKYIAKCRHFPVIEPEIVWCYNLLLSTKASWLCQSSDDPYDVSSDNEEYLMPNHIGEMIPSRSACTSSIRNVARVEPVRWIFWVPDLSYDTTCCFWTGQTSARNCEPGDFAGFG